MKQSLIDLLNEFDISEYKKHPIIIKNFDYNEFPIGKVFFINNIPTGMGFYGVEGEFIASGLGVDSLRLEPAWIEKNGVKILISLSIIFNNE